MSNCKLLIIVLLCLLAKCSKFQWNTVSYKATDVKVRHAGHQGSSTADMLLVWQDKYYGHNAFVLYSLSPEGRMGYLSTVYNTDDRFGYENVVLQAPARGNHIYFAYFGCKNNAAFGAPRPCARTYFRESANAGRDWFKAIEISKDGEYIAPNSPLAMFTERDTQKVYIFYALQSKEDENCNDIIGYATNEEDRFTQITLISKVPRITGLKVGVTKDNDNHFVHLLYTDDKGLYHASSADKGKTWTRFSTIASDISLSIFNFAAIDPQALEDSFFVQYRDEQSQKLMMQKATNHGKTFNAPIVIDRVQRPSREAIGMCGSKDKQKFLVVTGYIDLDPDNGFIRFSYNNERFMEVPYPFNKIEGAIANLVIDCAYQEGNNFYITAAMLAGGAKNLVYYAQGTLDISGN